MNYRPTTLLVNLLNQEKQHDRKAQGIGAEVIIDDKA
jgi:hypothetical protein